MDMIFGLLGFLAMIVGFILLVINAIRKKPLKKYGIVLGAGFLFLVIGLAMPGSASDEAADTSDTQAVEAETVVPEEVEEEVEEEPAEEVIEGNAEEAAKEAEEAEKAAEEQEAAAAKAAKEQEEVEKAEKAAEEAAKEKEEAAAAVITEAETAYADFVVDFSSRFSDNIGEFGALMGEGRVGQDDWTMSVVVTLAYLDEHINEIYDYENVPDKFVPAHEKLTLAMDEYKEVVNRLPKAIDNMDAAEIEALTDHMAQGVIYVNQASELVPQ